MARAGRKRKQGVKRQPNGQPSRSVYREEEAALTTVVEARMRLYGISKERAKLDLAGYEIGRMALAGVFGDNPAPYIAAVQEYVTATADYMRIKNPQQPFPRAMDYLAGRGASLKAEPALKTVDRIERRYEQLHARLRRADANDRIRFHEVAFHDRMCGVDWQQSVVRCIEWLMDA